MPQVMTGDDLQRVIRRIAHEVLETHSGAEDVVLVGILTRGAHLARSLGTTLESFEDCHVPVAELDIAAYRDDRDPDASGGPRRLEVDVTGKHVILVDDVLYTGRTVRAALDALADTGRAATTELAVLVDRGHRELPIRADYVGKNIPTSRRERVQVRIAEVDGVEGVWIERSAA